MKNKSLIYKLNIIKSSGDIISNLVSFLKNDNGSGYDDIIKILKNKKNGKIILDNLLPKECNTLWSVQNKFIFDLPIEKRLLWNVSLIKENLNIINYFIEKKKLIEKYILNGEYSHALNLLDDVDNKCCCSIWSIEVRLLIEKLSTEYIFEFDTDGSLGVLIDLLRNKVDSREQGARYQKKMKDIISRVTSSSYLQCYLCYKLSVENRDIYDNLNGVLTYESINSILDIFLTTQDLILQNENIINDSKLRVLGVDVFSKLSDVSLYNVFLLKIGQEVIVSDKYAITINEFEKGNFKYVINEFNANQDEYITHIHLIVLYILALLKEELPINSNIKNTLGEQIINCLYCYFTDNNLEHKMVELDTICRTIDMLYCSKELFYILKKFSHLINYNKTAIMNNIDTFELVQHFEKSNSKLINIFYLDCNFFNQEGLFNIKSCKEFNGNAVKQYFLMISNYYSYYYYLNKEDYESAIKILINSYISSSIVIGCMNISKISHWINNSKYNLKINLEQLIYINLVDEFKDIRTSEFLNFLDKYNLTEPLGITKITNISNDLKNFYLYKLCTIENLSQLYYLFEKNDEVEDYRIEICKYLLGIFDGENKKNCEEEINIIYRQRTKRQKLNKLDEGKLSVDFDAINATVYKEILGLFNLFLKIPENELELLNANNLLDKEMSELIKALGFKNSYKYVSKRSVLIKEIYEIYLKEFCFGKNGLDIYLSTRIRHGTFANQIYKIFNSHNISKESFIFIDKSITKRVLKIYEKIESAINDIIQNKLKVNYEKDNSLAIFNYYEDDYNFYEALSNTIGKECSTVEECLSAFADTIMYKTNIILKNIKTQLLPELRTILITTLDEILKTLNENLNDKNAIAEIEKNINYCNIELKDGIEDICGWFTLSRDNSWADFTFEELIELCNEIGKKLFVNFNKAKIDYDIDKRYIINGKYYTDLNDILIILQNNAFTHSSFNNEINLLQLSIKIYSNEDDLNISVCNNLNVDKIDIKELDNKIIKINKYFKDAQFNEAHLHQEGGTGLFRVINILFYILKIGKNFEVYRDNNLFKVNLVLNKGVIINETNSIN